MGLRLVTAPVSTPVTTAEAKAWCRIDGSDEDGVIDALISAATGHIERYTGLALMEQTWELVLDSFQDTILMPKGPVSAIVSVKYYDTDSVEQTVGSGNYALDDVSDPQWLVKASGFSWPAVVEGVNNVTIRFVCGFSTLPPEIGHAVKMLVAHWHQNRETASDRGLSEMPFGVAALLANHRRYSF